VSDEEKQDQGAPSPPPPPPIGVDRVEFRRGLNDLHREITEQGVSTRQFIGWFAATVGLLVVLMGLYAMYSKDGGW